METTKLVGNKRPFKRQDTPLVLKVMQKSQKADLKRDEALEEMEETDEETEDVLEIEKEVTNEETSEKLDRVTSKLGKMKHNSQNISSINDAKKSS